MTPFPQNELDTLHEFFQHPGYALYEQALKGEIHRLMRGLLNAREPALIYELQGRIKMVEYLLSQEFRSHLVKGGMETLYRVEVR